jgi:hypothetical protein
MDPSDCWLHPALNLFEASCALLPLSQPKNMGPPPEIRRPGRDRHVRGDTKGDRAGGVAWTSGRVSVVRVKEILRLWLRGHGLRPIARLTQTDRKTVRRYPMHGLMGERRNHADATNPGIEPVHRRQWCASAPPDQSFGM